jgi:hypothetical protein
MGASQPGQPIGSTAVGSDYQYRFADRNSLRRALNEWQNESTRNHDALLQEQTRLMAQLALRRSSTAAANNNGLGSPNTGEAQPMAVAVPGPN